MKKNIWMLLLPVVFLAGFLVHDPAIEFLLHDTDRDTQIAEVASKLELGERANNLCERAFFATISPTLPQETIQQCISASIDFSEWATKVIFHKDLVPIKGDMLKLRDDLNELSYIGSGIQEGDPERRQELTFAIPDAITKIRQFLSQI